MFRDDVHRFSYLAVKANWPKARIFSKAYIDTKGPYGEILNVNPSYASTFLIYDKNAPKEEQIACIWVLAARHKVADPESGMLNVSETLMRKMISDFYLYSNLTLTSGLHKTPKVRIVIMLTITTKDNDKQILFSKPIKMSHLVSWNGVGDLSFESPKLASAYASKITKDHIPVDPRVVMPGHYFNLLRSHDYVVQVVPHGRELQYKYPFDFVNPADRANRKYDPDYLYTGEAAMRMRTDDIVNQSKDIKDEDLYTTVGIQKDAKGNKILRQIYRPYSEITAMDEVLVKNNVAEPVVYVKQHYPEFMIFPDYTWYLNTPLSKAAKELQ